MSYYSFYDTNVFDGCNEEYDIQGEKYVDLIKLCFKHSKFFSFVVYGQNQRAILQGIPEELSLYEIEADDFVINNYRRYFGAIIKCYIACPASYELLIKMNDSIFKWISVAGHTSPEDLAFFRKDSSIFFSSVIHEGECMLFPRDCEDVSSVLNNDHWYFVDND